MELNFTKEGNKWVAEFEAPSDFNLHIEREQVAYINIMQRGSSNGEYDLAKSFSADKTFDYDFGALVYPKWIKVVSGSLVVSASVNFNEGGGSGSGSGEAFTIEYYRIDWSKYDQDPILSDMLKYAHVFNAFDNVAVKTIQNRFQDDFKYSKFGGCSIPLYLIETEGENLIYDTGSWLKNFLAHTPYLDAQPSWLVTITKEEFLLFGDDSEYDYPAAP